MNKNILSSEEYKRLQVLINDPIMREALRKVMTYEVYYSGTIKPEVPVETKNFAFGCLRDLTGKDRKDEDVGRLLRVITEAVGVVERALQTLDSLKEVKESKKDNKNPAR